MKPRTLDLDSLELMVGHHKKASGQMCVMEAVAYVAGEKWTDAPECASPVISAFLRSYNDAVSDQVRQGLKPYIPRLIGTRGTPEMEERRSLAAADWLIRTYTPAWLRLAGLRAPAERLESLPEITSLAQVPSIKPALEAARNDTRAARAAAWAAARAAARAAAWAELKPTVERLQSTVPELIEKMLAITVESSDVDVTAALAEKCW